MQESKEIFNISVEINKGLEPLTLTIVAYKQATLHATQELGFKVLRDNDTLAVLSVDSDHRWKLVEGDMKHFFKGLIQQFPAALITASKFLTFAYIALICSSEDMSVLRSVFFFVKLLLLQYACIFSVQLG